MRTLTPSCAIASGNALASEGGGDITILPSRGTGDAHDLQGPFSSVVKLSQMITIVICAKSIFGRFSSDTVERNPGRFHRNGVHPDQDLNDWHSC
jgi:hypothetical protein